MVTFEPGERIKTIDNYTGRVKQRLSYCVDAYEVWLDRPNLPSYMAQLTVRSGSELLKVSNDEEAK
jgi:hypothetical protein